MRPRPLLVLSLLACAASSLPAQIRVHPTGVNVATQGATTVFLTFGGLAGYRAADAVWCGSLVPAAPDVGNRCDPSTILGTLPPRYDLSRLSGGTGFTDIMSIPPSVARRAYLAAAAGEITSFFYVRRFVHPSGGPDQFVTVTCRLTGGGARVPFSLTRVELGFDVEAPVLFVERGARLPEVTVDVAFTGTGVLRGRWEVVRPGDVPPESFDLLPEASLPAELRGTQRRFTEIQRFSTFLAPVGRTTLPGPDPARLPTDVEGPYQLLLRLEASDDKEGDSDLGAAGAGTGVVHSGGVAGFAIPPLRYVVGGGSSALLAERSPEGVRLRSPDAGAVVPGPGLPALSWDAPPGVPGWRVRLETPAGTSLVQALLPGVASTYAPPPWVAERAPEGRLRWRVERLGPDGEVRASSEWRELAWER